jgi:DNA polymerase I-like protein with 3'-5' exonuclease and polymerase domains
LMDLFKASGLKINPNSSPDIAKLFRKLGLPITEYTATEQASFTDSVIKSVDHPTVKLLRHVKKLGSIITKLTKYKKAISTGGVMRYALHQLRAAKSDGDEGGETGTVTGRFTSTQIVEGVGLNIQQVMKPEKQFLTFGDEFFIRELHIPSVGYQHLSTDAEQIQYRLFAHDANNPKIIQAYQENPWMSFHKKTQAMFQVYIPDLPYKNTKDCNFAKLFAAGPSKLGLMLGHITVRQFNELKAQKANRYHPYLKKTLEILKIYDQELPEVAQLLKDSSELAETRGFIKTILGRRIRFPNGHRLHKAFNGRIQGSEADIVKTKAVELHNARKDTGLVLRFQVHDEFNGDIQDDEGARKVAEILNFQTFEFLRVPILWGTKVGSSWGACAKDELDSLRKLRAQGLI